MLQAPRLRPCERRNVPAADAAACTTAVIAGVAGVAVAAPPAGAVIFEVAAVAAVAAAAGVAAGVDTADCVPPGGGGWCRGIAFRYSPGSGSHFCRWRLARCGPSLRSRTAARHDEAGLAVIVCHPPSALTWRALPARALPRCRLSLFGSGGQVLLGRGRSRRDVLPSNNASGQYGAVGNELSHAVAGVVDAESDVVAVLCFRL